MFGGMAIKPKGKKTTQVEKKEVKNKTSNSKDTAKIQQRKKATTKKTTAKKSTTRTKYDWKALKQEFFESDFIEVAPFIQKKLGQDTGGNGQIAKNTKGWGEEKKQIKEDARKQAMKEFKSTLNYRWQEVLDKMEQAHIHGLEDLVEMIMEQGKSIEKMYTVIVKDEDGNEIEEKRRQTHIYRPILGHKDVIEIVKHIKLEKGEPTDIVNNGTKAKQWLAEMRASKNK